MVKVQKYVKGVTGYMGRPIGNQVAYVSKVFDGKEYDLKDVCNTKAEAQKKANGYRKKGLLVRVDKCSVGYRVWLNNSKMPGKRRPL